MESRIEAETLFGDEWAEWFRLTPQQRWQESEKLWEVYLSLGGSLDPEPDPQSPFFDTFQEYGAYSTTANPFAGYNSLKVFRHSEI